MNGTTKNNIEQGADKMQGKRWSSLQLANLRNSSIVCASILLCEAKSNFTKWHSQIPNADSQFAIAGSLAHFLWYFEVLMKNQNQACMSTSYSSQIVGSLCKSDDKLKMFFCLMAASTLLLKWNLRKVVVIQCHADSRYPQPFATKSISQPISV
jgi:hypothetical protein